MPCTPPDKLILLGQTVGSVAVMAGSVAVCICMSMHQEHFKGHCALFSTGVWQERDGQLKVDWASQAYCNFSIFVAVISFLTGAVLSARFLQLIWNGKEESFLSTFLDTLATGCLLVMLFISSFFVSFGSLKWCRQIVQRFPHCEEAAGNDILKADEIDTNGFYWMLTVAQFGNWLSFLGCITVFMTSTIKVVRYHVAENLRVTMMKARTKLIYSDNDPMIQDVPTSYTARPLSSRYIDRDGNPVPAVTRGMIGEDPFMEQQPQQQHRFLPPGASSLNKRRRRRKRVPTAADQEDIIEEAAAIGEEEEAEGVDNTMQIQSDRHSQAYHRSQQQQQQQQQQHPPQQPSPSEQQQPTQAQVEEETKYPSMGNQIRVVTDDEEGSVSERRRSAEEKELAAAEEASEDEEGEGEEEGEEEEDEEGEDEEGDEEDEGNSSRSSSRSSSNSSQEDVSSNRSVSSRNPSGK